MDISKPTFIVDCAAAFCVSLVVAGYPVTGYAWCEIYPNTDGYIDGGKSPA